MKIPGFTAERSMVVRGLFYGIVRGQGGLRVRQGITPAMMSTLEFHCSNICGYDPTCVQECTTALGGEGAVEALAEALARTALPVAAHAKSSEDARSAPV